MGQINQNAKLTDGFLSDVWNNAIPSHSSLGSIVLSITNSLNILSNYKIQDIEKIIHNFEFDKAIKSSIAKEVNMSLSETRNFPSIVDAMLIILNLQKVARSF